MQNEAIKIFNKLQEKIIKYKEIQTILVKQEPKKHKRSVQAKILAAYFKKRVKKQEVLEN